MGHGVFFLYLESRLLICSGVFHSLSNRLDLEVSFRFEGGGRLLVISGRITHFELRSFF